MIFGGIIDLIQLGLLAIFIGVLVNPLFSFIAFVVFWITLDHYDVPMFTGKRSWASLVTCFVEAVPVFVSGLAPGWFGYAAYLTFAPRMKRKAEGIIEAS